jgi:hypothetical protein
MGVKEGTVKERFRRQVTGLCSKLDDQQNSYGGRQNDMVVKWHAALMRSLIKKRIWWLHRNNIWKPD